ncbi:MAG: polysaccharide biosynthesis tyrosine autokinase [Rhodospirillales bacterium]|nr:polysaccharide biosynthesis tyrosine autokinase [Rhodospirillales bacterium]
MSPEQIQIIPFLKSLWLRKYTFLAAAASVLALCLLILIVITPKYTAEAVVLVDKQHSLLTDIEALVPGLGPNTDIMNTQAQIVASYKLVEQVSTDLNLYTDPEFAEDDTFSPLDYVTGPIKAARAWVNAYLANPASAPTEGMTDAERDHYYTTQNVIDALNVTPVKDSTLMLVDFTSEDPVKAAKFVNLLTGKYVDSNLEYRYETARRTIDWANEKIAELRKKVENSEGAIERYRLSAGLLETKEGSVATQQLSDINIAAANASAERSAKEGRLREIRGILNRGGAEALAEVLASPVIQQLTLQEAAINREIAQLGQDLGPRHPTMAVKRAELKDIQSKINVEVNKVVSQLQNEVDLLRAREVALGQQLKQMEQKVGTANAAMIQLRSLERTADADRLMLDTFLKRTQETYSELDRAGETQSDIRIISPAVPPAQPSFPQMVVALALAVLLAGIAGVAAVMLAEQLSDVFRSSEDLEKLTGLHVQGLLPRVKNNNDVLAELATNTSSLYSEQIRSLSTGLLLLERERRGSNVLLIMSSRPAEGKSTLAASLARARALTGQKVILIDADLRKPTMHTLFGISRQPGLAELIGGGATLSQVRQKDRHSNLHLLPVGTVVENGAASILHSKRLETVINELRELYDTIIIDTPPLLAVPDAYVLSTLSDIGVFAVRWNKTRRSAAVQVLKGLRRESEMRTVAVMTMVDAKRYASYGYTDSGRFDHEIQRYYLRKAS